MSVQLSLADFLVEAAKKPREENNAPAQSSTEVTGSSNSGSTDGGKYLNRMGRNNTVSSETVDSTNSTTSSTDASQQNTILEVFELLTQVSMNLADTSSNSAQVLQMTSDMAKASSSMAVVNQQNLNDQIAEQQKRQKRMKILGWAVKTVAVVITVAMIAGSGGVLAAPLTTALMVGLTSLTIAKPELINDLVGKIATVLENKADLPPKVAEALAIALVFIVILALTAGAGAADSSALVGQATAEASGSATAQRLAGTAVEEGTLQYGTMKAGNMLLTFSELLATTQVLTKILLLAFPNNPNIDRIIGSSLTIVLALAGGVGGGSMMASSGYFEGALGASAQANLQRLTNGLRILQGTMQGGEGWMSFEQGMSVAATAEIAAAQEQLRVVSSISNQLAQIVQNNIKLTNSSLEQNSQAIQSLTLVGETVLSKLAS